MTDRLERKVGVLEVKMRTKLFVQLSAVLVSLAAFPAQAQSSPPRFPANTYYGDARAKLQELGYAPVMPKRARGRCEQENIGRENVCKQWPEVQSCAGTGLARCFFRWRRGSTVIEVRTVGDARETVDRVRCHSGCR
jgi:hypothetical protein